MQSVFDVSVLADSTMVRIVLEDNTDKTETKIDIVAAAADGDKNAETTNKPVQREFNIHKQLLHRSSGYFQALDRFEEGTTNTVTIKDVSPQAFARVANWIYTSQAIKEASEQTWDAFLQAYIIGDRLIMPAYKNHVMDTIRKLKLGNDATPETLLQLQDLGFTETTPITSYILDSVAYEAAITNLSNFKMLTGGGGGGLFMKGGPLAVALLERVANVMGDCDICIQLRTWNKPKQVDPFDENHEDYHECTDGI